MQDAKSVESYPPSYSMAVDTSTDHELDFGAWPAVEVGIRFVL